jgi:hypothetical protein
MSFLFAISIVFKAISLALPFPTKVLSEEIIFGIFQRRAVLQIRDTGNYIDGCTGINLSLIHI